mgnify:CR=1 FL=1
MFENFEFLHPQFLWLLVLIPFIAVWYFLIRKSDSATLLISSTKGFKLKPSLISKLKPLLPLIKSNNLRYFDTVDTMTYVYFGTNSYLQVGHGLGLIEKSKNLSGYENIIPSPFQYKNIIDAKVKSAQNHTSFIKQLHEMS